MFIVIFNMHCCTHFFYTTRQRVFYNQQRLFIGQYIAISIYQFINIICPIATSPYIMYISLYLNNLFRKNNM